MFNPQRLAKFLAKFWSVLLPVFGIAFALSLVTEVSVRHADIADLVVYRDFWLSIIRDVAPFMLALIGVYVLAIRFVQGVYGIEDSSEARHTVNRLLFGLSSFGPWLRVAGGIAEGDENHTLKRVGGPGHLVVYNDSAILLQKGGEFSRVVGKGFPRLEPFESIYETVDLRPNRWVYSVSAMSKEGIPITCEADISYQIDNEGVSPTEEMPFPVSEQKIFQAATCTWIREADRSADTRTMDWAGRVIISETEGNLRTILSRYPLDQLIGFTSMERDNPREEIRQELEWRLRSAVPKLGAQILSVELGDIKVQDRITQQWIDAWRAEWNRWATERKAIGEAAQAEQLENAKTRAQVMMLTSIAEAFRTLPEEEQAVTSRLILTRLFMVLSRAPTDPLTRINLPKEAIDTIKLLKDSIL